MNLLLLGIILFFILHMLPYFGIHLKAAITGKIGALPYKALFAALSLSSFVFIVIGWQETTINQLYTPPSWGPHVTPLFVLAGIVLFVASNAPTNLRRIFRHPQLLGLGLWGVGHLLSNGEDRSVILFGGMVLFAGVAIWASNRRDGAWVKRAPVSRISDVITVAIGVAVFAALLYFHGGFTGVQIVP